MHGPFAKENDLPLARCKVVWAMHMLNLNISAPTAADFLVVKRGKHIEVWTLKSWPVNKLIMVPFTTEIKDRYWTQNRSALVEASMLQKGKHLVMDGRHGIKGL